MNKRFFLIGLITLFLILPNCSEHEVFEDFDAQISTLYSHTKLKSSVDENSIESKVSLVQRIGKDHAIAQDYLEVLKSKGFDREQLDLNDIQRISCFNTDVTILSMPVKRGKQKIISYVFNDQYCVFTVSIEKDHWEYRSLDGELFVSANVSGNTFQIDSSKQNKAVEAFSSIVYNATVQPKTKSIKLKSTGSEDAGYECCRKAPSYSECLNCTFSYFGINEWYMQGALALYTPELIIAIYTSCIGAGPNAWC
jgi:hypothetical protein